MKFGFGQSLETCDGASPAAKYELELTERAEHKMTLIEKLESKDVRVFVEPSLPQIWPHLSCEEKLTYIETHKFDLEVKSIYAHCEADKQLISEVVQLEEFETLFFCEDIADPHDFKLMANLNNIKYLTLRGSRFNDEIIDTFFNLKVIETLDIIDANISQPGIDLLKNILPLSCKVNC